MEVTTVGVGGKNGAQGLGGADRDGALFHDDLGAFRNLGDGAGSELDVAQVSGASRADAGGLGGSADADKNDVGITDGILDPGMEMEVLAAGTLNDVIETGLKDGKFV